MNRGKMNILVIIAMAVVLAIGLSSCGRKGPLEAPGSSATDTDDGISKKERKKEKADRRFILDGLI